VDVTLLSAHVISICEKVGRKVTLLKLPRYVTYAYRIPLIKIFPPQRRRCMQS
jgi:hypothetical protein